MSDYLSRLNPAQQAAVAHQEGPMMIVAGAGSGKTRVLTYRVAHLIEKGVDPYRILVLTFTNKAAEEMKTRIGGVIGEADAKAIWMGTFHSVFGRILGIESEKLGYPRNFTIYDTADSERLMKGIIKEMQLDKEQYKAKTVLSRISKLKNNLITVKAYFNNQELMTQDAKFSRPRIGDLYKAYADRCFKAGAMDFDDLLLKTNELLARFSEVREKYQELFRYIMVDEYQDTNYTQYIIIKTLSKKYQNIGVVGDDAQSIYGFRGADIENILNFQKDYPSVRIFKLEQNYRSSSNIVNASNDLIKKNKQRIDKNTWTENAMGDKIYIKGNASDREEGRWVAENIGNNLDKKGGRYRDYCVLYRTNSQSRTIEEAMRKLGIPYKIFGGLSFYNRKEIKDVMAYLRLIINPKDEESFRRIINYPARGIGDTTLTRIGLAANEYDCSLFEILERLHEIPIKITTGVKDKLVNFSEMIRLFQQTLEYKNAFEITEEVIKKTGIIADLEKIKKDYPDKIENIQEFLNGARSFVEEAQKEERNDSLIDFLSEASLATDMDKDDKDRDQVALMTIHSSKGLEFNTVYIVGMEENLFPSPQSFSQKEDLEEERRLFYVAMTRAEKTLYLSYAQTRFRWGKSLVPSEVSRFVNELDEKYTQQLISKNTRPKKRFSTDGTNSSNHGPINRVRIISQNKHAAAPHTSFKRGQKTNNSHQVKAGQTVLHEKFGKGLVLNVTGAGNDLTAIVNFENKGKKRLLLRFATLKIVD